jgi:hypothetical protein
MTHPKKAETKALDKAKSHTVHTLKKSRQKREKLRKSGKAYSVAVAETRWAERSERRRRVEGRREAEARRRGRAAD